MTRNGTVALSRIAFLTALVCGPSVAHAQRATPGERSSGDWEARRESILASASDRDRASAAAWKPQRNGSGQAATAAHTPTPEKKWIAPSQTNSHAQKAAPQAQPASNPKLAGPRPPKPFVPPADAQQLASAPHPVPQQTATSSAQHSAAQSTRGTNVAGRPAPRTQEERVSYRPRPVAPANRPSMANRLFDDTWIGSLRQVAYQAGEPEELYAPPGQDAPAPMPRGPMMAPQMETGGEWIGSPGGACCDGSCGPNCGCGPDCDCGPMCGDGIGCCSSCGECRDENLDLCTVGPHDDEACHTVRIRLPKCQEFMVFGGVHGFKGPYDRNRDSGNFGFQEGFNIGAKLPFLESGYQVGYQALQSQLNGDESTGIADSFAQHFFTTGVFHRQRDGFQGGVVWDLLLDERESSVAFSQIRGEFGFVDCGCHEFGVTGAIHLKDNVFTDVEQETITTFQTVDQYLLYYRMHGPRGGEGRVYGGLTDDVDGIIGADFAIPLTDSFALIPAFTYMIPDSNHAASAASEEAWNLSIALVWHWRGHARSCHSSPYRPLFNVADNGYMIIDNRP